MKKLLNTLTSGERFLGYPPIRRSAISSISPVKYRVKGGARILASSLPVKDLHVLELEACNPRREISSHYCFKGISAGEFSISDFETVSSRFFFVSAASLWFKECGVIYWKPFGLVLRLLRQSSVFQSRTRLHTAVDRLKVWF